MLDLVQLQTKYTCLKLICVVSGQVSKRDETKLTRLSGAFAQRYWC